MGAQINVGLVTSEAEKEKYYKELDDAGLPTIIADAQKQIDAYMAKQK